MPTKKLVVPTIHLNGSNKQRLLDALQQAATVVAAARESLKGAAPHGRDYYVQKDERAFVKANTQAIDRMMALEDVENELTAIWQGIQDNVTEVEVSVWQPVGQDIKP